MPKHLLMIFLLSGLIMVATLFGSVFLFPATDGSINLPILIGGLVLASMIDMAAVILFQKSKRG